MPGEETTRQRLDKWLWHVRLQPSRSKAAAFIKEGFARINGVRTADPSKPVKPGDVLTLALHNRVIVVRVTAILPRRVPAQVAQTAFEAVSAE